jgi:hypothetical protein
LTSNPLVRDAAYREVVLFSYVEYGISDDWTIIGALPYKILTSKRTEITELADLIREVDVTNAGLSDLTLGVRRALVRGTRPLAIDLLGSVPLGYDRSPDNGGPALGSGYADIGALLHAGVSLGGGYASASAGYRVRGGPLADVYGFGLQAGAGRDRVSGYALLEGWYSTVEPEPLDVSSTVAIANQDVLKLIVSVAFQITDNAAAVADAYHVLDGRNTPTGTTGALSLVLTR